MSQKKQEEPVLSPGACIRNMQLHNEAVLALLFACKMAAEILPQGKHKAVLDKQIAEVNKFYEPKN